MKMVSMIAQANKILVSVDRHGAYDFSGIFYTSMLDQWEPFASAAELVLKLERQFDIFQFPQRSQECRSLLSADLEKEDSQTGEGMLYPYSAEKERKPYEARFLVQVLFRQNGSWQGRVEWLDQEEPRAEDFRSTLELLHMLMEAVHNSVEKEKADKIS